MVYVFTESFVVGNTITEISTSIAEIPIPITENSFVRYNIAQISITIAENPTTKNPIANIFTADTYLSIAEIPIPIAENPTVESSNNIYLTRSI
jgi:hypothetical protein